MPLEHSGAQHLLAAHGYVELGMFADADQLRAAMQSGVIPINPAATVKNLRFQAGNEGSIPFTRFSSISSWNLGTYRIAG